MGERYTGSVEVMGSNPTVSIKSLEIIGFQGFFCVPGGFYLVVHDCLRQSWFLEKKAFGKNVRHELLKMSVKKTDYGILHIIGRPLTLFLCIWGV